VQKVLKSIGKDAHKRILVPFFLPHGVDRFSHFSTVHSHHSWADSILILPEHQLTVDSCSGDITTVIHGKTTVTRKFLKNY